MKRPHALAGLVTAVTLLAACGGSPTATSTSASGGGGTGACTVSNTTSTDGGGASLKIGQKGFTEEKLLAAIARIELDKHGFSIDNSTTAADPAIGNALASGQIQMLWQYTGTELGSYLNVSSVPSNLDQAFQQARQLDAAKNLCWVAETMFNDTNGLGIRQSDTSTLGTTISSLTAYMQGHNGVKICIQSEFRTRPDGLPGLAAKYGSVWSSYNFTDISTSGEAALKANQCEVAEIYTTDAAIQADNLVALKDDKGLFPADNAGLIVRADVLSKYPAIANILDPLAAKLTTPVMLQLNTAVDVNGQSVDSVASGWLSQNGG
ncbi:MAG: ABC transporter substrate-binding protein [Candidatus Dormibacteria bacterium]